MIYLEMGGTMNQLKEKIKDCEDSYVRCFSTTLENQDIIRYRDNQLRDMYMHNFTYLKSGLNKEKLNQLISEEIHIARQENIDFCRITMDEVLYMSYLDALNFKIEREHNGAYVYIPMKSPEWNIIDGYDIIKVSNSNMIEDIISMDLIHDSVSCGEDFCHRRPRRKGIVYLSDQTLDSYIIYLNGIPVGKCDLFLYNGIAKIEDFSILPNYQHKKVGTTILKYLIDISLMQGANTIYLIADEDDTPKEMYEKLGFKRVYDYYGLMIK